MKIQIGRVWLSGPGGEGRHDDLVEAEREGEQCPGQQARAQQREGHAPERREGPRPEVGRRLLERAPDAAQPRGHVVEDEDDAEGRVADDDREESRADAEDRGEEVLDHRLQRDTGDDAGQRDRQDDEDRDRVLAEEVDSG